MQHCGLEQLQWLARTAFACVGVVLQEAVTARSTTGKALRRKVIKGAVMVFVTAGYSGTQARGRGL